MSQGTVIAAVDGSAESQAAAQWAAREALLRGLSLHIVHAWQDWSPGFAHAPFTGTDTAPGDTTITQHWAERVPRDVADRLREGHPGLRVSVEQVFGRPVDVLLAAANKAEVLVLGSRGLGAPGWLPGRIGVDARYRARRAPGRRRAGRRAGRGRKAARPTARPTRRGTSMWCWGSTSPGRATS